MRSVAFLVALIFLFFISANSVFSDTDILGWGKVNWGMTQSEVKKLYDMDWADDVAPKCLMKEGINVQDHEFGVVFWFSARSPSGKLYKVEMFGAEHNQMDFSCFDNIFGLLVSKYGKPDTTEVTISHFRIMLWLKRSGQLELNIMPLPVGELGKRSVWCTITYTAVGANIDKL